MKTDRKLTVLTTDALEKIVAEMRELGKDTYLLRDETLSPNAAMLVSFNPLLIDDVQGLFNAYAEDAE